MKPSVGRIVHFYSLVADKEAHGNSNDGPIPAIITRVWNDEVVNLTCFPDYGLPVVRSSINAKAEGFTTYWDWPSRVE